MATAHERYHDRLSVLADDALVTEVVRSWIGDTNRVEWSRHFGRFDPSRSPWATLVHQPAGPGPMITIDAFEQDAARPTRSPRRPAHSASAGSPTIPSSLPWPRSSPGCRPTT